ncbi:hypothetical protein [Lacipirellula parvula]|uniref:Uncharacterized protein n=1 Tax=Lacipirellula parvula TaxID=2650471 RepID=A0A5K7XK10_9BACT|nr:hypothetical protein [Lacipirellula parvula]BBO34593.1 hypothetical protein PLANPX_4205 [Lacipirellula parvula]
MIRRSFSSEKDFVIELTKEEFTSLHAAKKGVFVALDVEEKYSYIVGNFREFELALLEHSLDGLLRFETEWSHLAGNIHRFNRLLVNFLTACRLYHDQVDREICQIFGHESSERAKLKAARNEEFDASASYRVMEGLRNYLQHRGLPLRRVNMDMFRNPDAPSDTEWRSIPYLDGPALVADGGFKKQIADDLTSLGKRVDVRRLTRDYFQSMARIHQLVRSLIKSQVTIWVEEVLRGLQRYEDKYQHRKHVEVASLADGKLVERFAIFEEPIKELNSLNKTLTAAANISEHFVSSRLCRSGPSVEEIERIADERRWEQLHRWHGNLGTD